MIVYGKWMNGNVNEWKVWDNVKGTLYSLYPCQWAEETLLLQLTVGILECKKLKKMDITGSSDPYVKIKLLDSKGKYCGLV